MKTLLSSIAVISVLALAPSAHADTLVATIGGCYDCGVYDTPSLTFDNTTGGTLTNAQMVLTGYQGANNGQTLTVNLSTLAVGSTQIFWGSLPGVSAGTNPGNLAAYDYDDEFIGTSHVIADPTCGGGGCAPYPGYPNGNDAFYAQVGNFSVTFTAVVSGGLYNGQSVYSVFSPNNNATSGFVGWQGLDPNGYSESPTYDVHTGIVTGDLANIYLGTPPATTPLPGAFPLFASGLGALGLLGWRRKRKAAAIAA